MIYANEKTTEWFFQVWKKKNPVNLEIYMQWKTFQKRNHHAIL